MTKMCEDHWSALRAAIDQRGLGGFVAEGGEQVAENLRRELEEGPSLDSFDPLMNASMAILSNAMTLAAERYMQSPLIVMNGDLEHPESECPICCLNWLHREHDASCTKPGCNYPKGERYEWMIDRAADDQDEALRALGEPE